jgi:hypothetical protein
MLNWIRLEGRKTFWLNLPAKLNNSHSIIKLQ